VLVAEVPRIECAEHGVLQIRVPWGEPGSRFTALYEALIIDWLQEASTSAVARQLGLSWNAVDGVQQRAVRRGLERRKARLPVHVGVDETSFQKRHEYVTVVVDQDEDTVVHIADGRGREALDAFWEPFSKEERAAVESVAMDMWSAYIASVREAIPEAEGKIAFDKFHVASHLGKAVDQVRRGEHKALRAAGEEILKGTKYLWLENPETMSDERWGELEALRDSTLKTARAWAIKQFAMSLWSYRTRGWARKAWRRWYAWAIRSRLEPVRRVARMIKKHLEGILNAIVLGVTNARSEAINAKIQWLKYSARGFRNRDRFRTVIYFHLGGLDLYPQTIAANSPTHTSW
jgi:transposase